MKWLMFWKRRPKSQLDEALFAGVAKAERRRIVRAVKRAVPKGLPASQKTAMKLRLLLDHLPPAIKAEVDRRADEIAQATPADPSRLWVEADAVAWPADSDVVLIKREPRQVVLDLLVGAELERRSDALMLSAA